jgi:general secretion pathway protein K
MNQRGIALPLVLWTITVLVTIVFSLALASRTEVRMTSNFRDVRERKFLAQAGIERGLLEIAYRTSVSGQAMAELQPWRVDGSSYPEDLGSGSYSVSIADESGKISINGLTDTNSAPLRNLIVRLGTDPETADTIVDSILDWKDADDLHRLHGAEDDYYQSLPVPYHARNNDFTAPEELLLVRGMTEQLFFGKGLVTFVTVYSKHSGINLESASREVLLSLPGMNEPLADSLIAYREHSPTWNEADAESLLGPVAEQARPYLAAAGTGIYTITSQGYRKGEKTVYSVTATVHSTGSGFGYLYYKSPSGGER